MGNNLKIGGAYCFKIFFEMFENLKFYFGDYFTWVITTTIDLTFSL